MRVSGSGLFETLPPPERTHGRTARHSAPGRPRPNIQRLHSQAGPRNHGPCPPSPQPRSRSLTLLAVYFGDVRLDIDPSFENDSDMVSAPPGQLASADRSKVVERDEKIYRKKPEFI
jgi:hypothetical protein